MAWGLISALSSQLANPKKLQPLGCTNNQTRADLRSFDTLVGFWGGESGLLTPAVFAPSGAELRGLGVGAQTLPDPIAAILKDVGVSPPTQVFVVAPRPFLATEPRPLARGRGGCCQSLRTGSRLLPRPKQRPLCGRCRHNPTSGVTKPRPRSCCVGGAVHREETAEWAWLKPVVRLEHAPESHLTRPRPRRCRVGGAISLAVHRVWPKLIASKLCTPLAPPRNTQGKNTLHIRTLLLKCYRPHPVSFRPRVRGQCCGV